MKNIIDQITAAYQTKSQCKIRQLKFDEVSKTFRYDKESNIIERRLKSGKWKKVDHMRANQRNGYHIIRFNGDTILTHRLIFSLANEVDVDNRLVINHLDEVRSNNHCENLELVSQRDNTSYSKESSTGITSVSLTNDGTSFLFRKKVGQIFLSYSTKSLTKLSIVSNEFDKMLAGQDNNLMSLVPDKVIKRWHKQLQAELNKVQREEVA